MAYRTRRRHTKRHTTRRRMGAVKGKRGSMSHIAGLIGGAVVTGVINKFVGSKLDPKILAGLEVVGGYFLPTFVKGDLMQGVGDGMIAAGGLSLLQQFGVLNGIPIIAGWRELNTVNGVEKKVTPKELSTQNSYRPSVSQVFNGIYNRRPMDGGYN